MDTLKTLRPENTLNPAQGDNLVDNTKTLIADIAADKTKKYEGGVGNTAKIIGNNHMPVASREAFQQGTQRFTLGDKVYECVKCLSDNTGEAQLFLVTHDYKNYALKIYYPNIKQPKDIMRVVRSMQFEMVMKVYEVGKTYVNGKHRDYELMEYMAGGTLNDYKLNGDIKMFRRIALQAAAALQYCHNNRLIHKDIKPENFFFRDIERTQLVLGDFGISTRYTTIARPLRTSQSRTPMYAAPEMYRDVIDGEVEIYPAADYYSLGLTLATLWFGESILGMNERAMMKNKNEGRLPRLQEMPEEVRILIEGLTVVNPQTRWKYEQVEQWFLGNPPEVDRSSPFLNYKSFVLDPERNLVAENVHELVPLMVDNEKIATVYLYDGKVTKWLEACGNTKLMTLISDIVNKRYLYDKTAGFWASIYAMDSNYPYVDIKGDKCKDMHAVAMSLMYNIDDYSALLRNKHDNLYLYLEARTDIDINTIQGYFATEDLDECHIGVMRIVYEIDPVIPLFSGSPSSTIEEIGHSLAYNDLPESDWRAVIDGRLLSWMRNHADFMLCEKVKIMTEGQPFSRSLAYKVLYTIMPNIGFDIKNADTPEKVGEYMAKKLMDWQGLSDDDFADKVKTYFDPMGRFLFYAELHEWHMMAAQAQNCFDLKSDENRNRLSAYDLRTAAYRFVRILGATPMYRLDEEIILKSDSDLRPHYRSLIKQELRNGCIAQWLSVFYHENPNEEFIETYSYERALERWIYKLGDIDPQYPFYTRYLKAKEAIDKRFSTVKDVFMKSRVLENMWRLAFLACTAVWVLLVVMIGFPNEDIAQGISGRQAMLEHPFLSMVLPLGTWMAIILAVRQYYKGFGSTMTIVWLVVGFFSAYIPVYILKVVESMAHSSFAFGIAVLVLTAICCVTALMFDYSRKDKPANQVISEALDDDVNTSLLEPLYYALKTKTFQFTGSKFSVLNDIEDRISSVSSERLAHYVLWTLLTLTLTLEFVIFSPKLINAPLPESITTTEEVQDAQKYIDNMTDDVYRESVNHN